MAKYVKDKDGKFAGSVGAGKSQVPSPSDAPHVRSKDTDAVSVPDDYSVSAAYEVFTAQKDGDEAAQDLTSGATDDGTDTDEYPRPGYTPLVEQQDAYQRYLDDCFENQVPMIAVETDECTCCGRGGQVTLAVEDYERGLAARREGRPIQECLPMLTPGMREQILTGIHSQCWDEMFGGDR